MPIPNQKWKSIPMDFIARLPRVGGENSIFVVVDQLTKHAHFISMDTIVKATKVVELFMQYIFKLHGLPKNIVSNHEYSPLQLLEGIL